MFALVRIVHKVNPYTLSFDELCSLYGEASWYLQLQCELTAEALSKIFK